MLVPFLVVLDAHERHREITFLGEIVMTCPDLDVVCKAQELTSRPEEISRTATREISACSAKINIQDRISAEDIV